MLKLEEDETLVCIEAPGTVESPDRFLQMIGGTLNMKRTFFDKNRRLEFRFRPDDPHCKPTCGERALITSFLIKVKIMKKKKKDKNSGEPEATKLVSSVISPISITYTFNNLCDFQYLPVQRIKDSSSASPVFDSILDEIKIAKMEKFEWTQRNLETTPLFLPPAVFSRMDTIQDYHFRKDLSSQKASFNLPENIIGRTRQRRSHHAIFVVYDVEQVPDRPNENATKQLQVKFIQAEDCQRVKEEFEKQPVWSKNALYGTLGINQDHLKYILPSLAYYFTTGPWRNFWIKLGYDPRKDREAAMLQSLDYRARLEGGISQKVKAKRNYASYLLPYKATNWSKPKTSLIHYPPQESLRTTKTISETSEQNENLYLFRRGLMPPYRQMFYMYKHIQVPEAQELMAANLKPPGATCDEKNGWFNAGLDSQLRNIMSNEIKSVIAAENASADDQDEETDLNTSKQSEDEIMT